MLWSWNETDDENWTHGTFDTKEEAMQDALGCRECIEKSLCTNNPTIYVGERNPVLHMKSLVPGNPEGDDRPKRAPLSA